MTNPPGKLIVFEGIDGAGKSTHASLLAKWLPGSGLMAEGAHVVLTLEPSGTGLGSVLADRILDHAIHDGAPATDRTRLLLYAADRAQHVEQVIEPALAAGHWVVCDRYSASMEAYQGYGHGMPLSIIRHLNAFATNGRQPDLTLWLDLSIPEARKRVCNRDGLPYSEDKPSAEFLARVRNGYRKTFYKNERCFGFMLCDSYLQRDLDISLSQSQIQTCVKEFFEG
jgi:dTMP kinase